MAERTVTITIPDVIEIHKASDVDRWADLFGINVGERGRKPLAALARAIRDYDGEELPTAIVDTDYFYAALAEEKSRESSPYGAELAALRAKRDQAIESANAEFESGRDALRAKYGVATGTGASKAKTGSAFVVSARTPMLDKETGSVLRTKAKGDKPGSVRFLPSARKVELTMATVRELTGTEGQRGRVSQADTLRAAVIAGEWFPVDLMKVDGWETVLLKDAQVTPVEHTVTADTPVADAPQDTVNA